MGVRHRKKRRLNQTKAHAEDTENPKPKAAPKEKSLDSRDGSEQLDRSYRCHADIPLMPMPQSVSFEGRHPGNPARANATTTTPTLTTLIPDGSAFRCHLVGRQHAAGTASVPCERALRKACARFVARAYSLGPGDPRGYVPLDAGPPPRRPPPPIAAADGGEGSSRSHPPASFGAVTIELTGGDRDVGGSWSLCDEDGEVDPSLLRLGQNEYYVLDVDPLAFGNNASSPSLSAVDDDPFHDRDDAPPSSVGVITIKARTAVGAIRALSTLSQLVVWTGTDLGIPCTPIRIKDQPRFNWRGLLLDTARHYLPVPSLKKVLNGMDALRMSVFHWHIVDAQSFPFQSTVYPLLSELGAYDPVHAVYTHDDVRDIVRHAADRGIRVVPEFDVPAHVRSWGRGYPNLTIECVASTFTAGLVNKSYTAESVEHAADLVALHPLREETFEFVAALFEEVLGLFPDKHFHLGGDELNGPCIETDPLVAEYALKNGEGWKDKLQGEFTSRVMKQIVAAGRKPVFWDESIRLSGVEFPPDSLFEWWSFHQKDSAEEVPRLAREKNVKLITTHQWYLDHTGADWWTRYTRARLYQKKERGKLPLVGGEACAWLEHAGPQNIEDTVFRHLPAVAENLWSMPLALATRRRNARKWEVVRRMGGALCLLNQREGLAVASIVPDHCAVNRRDVAAAPPPPGGAAFRQQEAALAPRQGVAQQVSATPSEPDQSEGGGDSSREREPSQQSVSHAAPSSEERHARSMMLETGTDREGWETHEGSGGELAQSPPSALWQLNLLASAITVGILLVATLRRKVRSKRALGRKLTPAQTAQARPVALHQFNIVQ